MEQVLEQQVLEGIDWNLFGAHKKKTLEVFQQNKKVIEQIWNEYNYTEDTINTIIKEGLGFPILVVFPIVQVLDL